MKIHKRLWLTKKRFQKKMNRKEISKILNISEVHYFYIEVGKRNPSVKLAKKIANLLDFDWTTFFKSKED